MTHVETEQVYRGNLDKLLSKVNEERGLDLSQYRRPYVERRIAARLRALGVHSYRQYSAFLDDHPDEYVRLLDVLTINVTDFFRDPPVYEAFRRKVIPAISRQKLAARQRMVRVWSAGCATGEEAYSLAMMMKDEFDGTTPRLHFSVLGTDIDPGALEIAKRAEYDVARLKHIPKQYQVKYLQIEGERFHISRQVASAVRFHRMSLFVDKPMTVCDVIFCRNVFIYFDRPQQERILDRFWKALTRGGFLVLGRSEKLAPIAAGRFELVDGRERIYRKPLTP